MSESSFDTFSGVYSSESNFSSYDTSEVSLPRPSEQHGFHGVPCLWQHLQVGNEHASMTGYSVSMMSESRIQPLSSFQYATPSTDSEMESVHQSCHTFCEHCQPVKELFHEWESSDFVVSCCCINVQDTSHQTILDPFNTTVSSLSKSRLALSSCNPVDISCVEYSAEPDQTLCVKYPSDLDNIMHMHEMNKSRMGSNEIGHTVNMDMMEDMIQGSLDPSTMPGTKFPDTMAENLDLDTAFLEAEPCETSKGHRGYGEDEYSTVTAMPSILNNGRLESVVSRRNQPFLRLVKKLKKLTSKKKKSDLQS